MNMNFEEWRKETDDMYASFEYYWDEMWGCWPSSFPMRMEKQKWELEFQKWIERGMPDPVDNYRVMICFHYI